MEELLAKLKDLAEGEIDFESLGKTIRNFAIDSLDYSAYLPTDVPEGNYGRNVLMMDPIECVVLKWPAKAESGIHRHDGFYGYVVVLEGVCDNIEYSYTEGELKELKSMRGIKGGIIPEQDGVIHKLVNPIDEEAVTLHIYYPPLESFDGMELFDIENERLGVLNKEAKTASWNEPETSFHEIKEKAFRYYSYGEHKKASHRINPVLPKPSRDMIYSMLKDYYAEQASEYDFFDLQHNSRNAYTSKINEIIGEEFSSYDCCNDVLTLACGTGRRAAEIKEIANKEYKITGVDLSPEMCEIAADKGLEVYCSRWLECELPDKKFDAATFLYAFGHISGRDNRLAAIKKINQHLEVGAPFFFDVFNLHDKNEWGPMALKAYEEDRLELFGYEKGDVFYKKNTGKTIVYLHYFEEQELYNLMEEAGFKIEYIKHIGYVKKPGELLYNEEEGALFVKAIKVSEA